jgi:hypothetical protein
MAPMFEPLLKIPVANALSFFGNHSATVLMDAGKLPDSPTANTLRIIMCIPTNFPTKALPIPANDQMISEKANPNLVPILSMKAPENKVTPA